MSANNVSVYGSNGDLLFTEPNPSQIALLLGDTTSYNEIVVEQYIAGTRVGPMCTIVCNPNCAPITNTLKLFVVKNEALLRGQQFIVVRFSRFNTQGYIMFYRPVVGTDARGCKIYGDFNMANRYVVAESGKQANIIKIFNYYEATIATWLVSLGSVPQ
jgi:hypothetical protein